MPYTLIPGKPGVAGVTPAGGGFTVFYFTVATQGKIRVQADLTAGTAPVLLELHLYKYPATSFVSKATFIEAVLPVGTHYIATWSMPGGVHFRIWQQRVVAPVKCPAGCVAVKKAARAVQDLAAHFHARAGLPPPTEEQLRALSPAYADLEGPAPPPAVRALAPAPAPRPVRAPAPGPATQQVLAGGPAVPVVLTAQRDTARFFVTIAAAGNYVIKVAPAPVVEQELFYLTLTDDRGQVVQASAEGSLEATLAAGGWGFTLAVPGVLLRLPRTFYVWVAPKEPAPDRPGLDNPPGGDGVLAVGRDATVDVPHTRPRAQLYVDVLYPGPYQVRSVETTGGGAGNPQADSPATLTLCTSDGVLAAGPTGPGLPLAAALTAGRWWVDLAVPDFRGRTTPRRYVVSITHGADPVQEVAP